MEGPQRKEGSVSRKAARLSLQSTFLCLLLLVGIPAAGYCETIAAPPSNIIFRIRLTDVTSYSGIYVGRTSSGYWTTFGPFNGGRKITFYEPGHCEEESVPENSKLRMWTRSENLNLCIVDRMLLECGVQEIEGQARQQGLRFFIDIGGRFFPATDTFSQYMKKETGLLDATNQLEEQGSKDLVSLLGAEEAKEIESFKVEGVVDGVRFQVTGMIVYDPFSPDRRPDYIPWGGAGVHRMVAP